MGLDKIKTINSEFAVLFLGLIFLGCEGGVELAKPQENQVQPTQETPNQNDLCRAKCVGVIDGDTVDILTQDKKQVRLRLASIDAPELGQPFGTTAKKFLSDLIFDKEISYKVTDTDRYDREIAFILIGSEDVNATMIQQGLAWHYVKYSDDESLTKLESTARKEKRGLWADKRHVAPWDWRKLSKEKRDKLR